MAHKGSTGGSMHIERRPAKPKSQFGLPCKKCKEPKRRFTDSAGGTVWYCPACVAASRQRKAG